MSSPRFGVTLNASGSGFEGSPFVSSGLFFSMISSASAFETKLTSFTSGMFDGESRLPIFSICALFASFPHVSFVQK